MPKDPNSKPLAPLQFGYHGTGQDIPVGGHVTPSSQVSGSKVRHPDASPDETYFSEHEGEAWLYAKDHRLSAGQMYGRAEYDDDLSDWAQMRPRVYVTKPIGDQFKDISLAHDPRSGARVVGKQQVVDTIWTPPPSDGETWVQGTLPEINWNKYNAPNWVAGTTHHGYFQIDDDRGYDAEGNPPPYYYNEDIEDKRAERKVNDAAAEREGIKANRRSKKAKKRQLKLDLRK